MKDNIKKRGLFYNVFVSNLNMSHFSVYLDLICLWFHVKNHSRTRVLMLLHWTSADLKILGILPILGMLNTMVERGMLKHISLYYSQLHSDYKPVNVPQVCTIHTHTHTHSHTHIHTLTHTHTHTHTLTHTHTHSHTHTHTHSHICYSCMYATKMKCKIKSKSQKYQFSFLTEILTL